MTASSTPSRRRLARANEQSESIPDLDQSKYAHNAFGDRVGDGISRPSPFNPMASRAQ